MFISWNGPFKVTLYNFTEGLIFNMIFRTHEEKGCWETFPLRWTDERSLWAAEQGGGEEDANWETPAATTQHRRPEYILARRQADNSEFRKTGAAKEGRTDRAWERSEDRREEGGGCGGRYQGEVETLDCLHHAAHHSGEMPSTLFKFQRCPSVRVSSSCFYTIKVSGSINLYKSTYSDLKGGGGKFAEKFWRENTTDMLLHWAPFLIVKVRNDLWH